MTATIGIDLGTTNSLVAVMEESGPKLIPNSLGGFLTPSVVGIEPDGRVLVGGPAREYQVLHPERCASVFKRHMGGEWSTDLGGRKMTAIELSSCVLRSLVADAEAYLGQPVKKAVITVPAYFNEEQRRATIAAGKMAGLEVERILNEPTAAAIAYGLHEQSNEKVAVIVDLGGGTFDVSVVEMFDDVLEVRASAGEIFLGGEDFTSSLAAQVLSHYGMTFERVEMTEPLRVSRLKRECEQAKRALSREEEATIRLPDKQGTFPDETPKFVVKREQFEQWTKPILDRILLPLRRALGDANIKRNQVDEVILVGGATRMRGLVDLVRDQFGRDPRCAINPDEVVAMGAAVHAGLIDRHEALSEMVVTDVAPFTLGIAISREMGGERKDGYFLPVINRNTTIPVSRVERVSTIEPNQTVMSVQVYQGESRKVEDNQSLGKFEVKGIPRGPAGQEVDVRFTYDLNGVLEVEATVVETKQKSVQIFTRHAKGLNPKQIEEAVAKLQALKMHPREETANRFLLRRAERLYAELPLRERRVLDGLISGFEVVLELRDKEAIENFREGLQNFLNEFDPEGEGDGNDSGREADW